MIRFFGLAAFIFVYCILAGGSALAANPAVEAGKKLYADGDARGAYLQWELAAVQGDAEAQFYVANMLASGEGVEKPNPTLAVQFYRLAARQGHLEAKLSLATCYRTGTGVKRNLKEAVTILYEVANARHPVAMVDLGDMFMGEDDPDEEFVNADENHAFEWYRLAARQGIVLAQLKTAQMYLAGVGTAEDDLAGMVWLTVARTQAQKGEELAMSARVFPLDRIVETDENRRTLRQIVMDSYVAEARRQPVAIVDEAERALTEWDAARF